MRPAGWIAALTGTALVVVLLLASQGFVEGPKDADRASSYPPPQVSVESLKRQAKRVTVRVRSGRCQNLFAGSGVIRGKEILTNRHVVAGAREIEVNTWDGASYSITRPARFSGNIDVARLPFPGPASTVTTATERSEPGSEMLLSGYPRGQRLHVEQGELLGYADGNDLRSLPFDGDVMVIRASIWRGDSGGPVFDGRGDLAGIIFAGSFEKKNTDRSETAFAIPIDEIDALKARDLEKVEACQPVEEAAMPLLPG